MWRRLCFSLVACVGCGNPSGLSGSFLDALPSKQTLEVSAPTAHAPAALRAGSAAALGETASLYVATRQTTAQVNGLVGGALDTLTAITRRPPAAVGPDSAAWGPITDALSPVAGRLVVTRVAPGAHTFRLDVRPKSGSDAHFRPFLQGASTGAGPGGPSQGSFAVDLDLAHQLDPVASPAQGALVAGWAVAPDHREVQRLLDAPQVDEVKALTQAAEVMKLETVIKRTHLTLLIRIRNALTEAQRSKLQGIRRAMP